METRRYARPFNLREQRARRLSRAGILPLPFANQSRHQAAGYDDPLCARRRFQFWREAKFFSRGPFLAKCKIFLRAGGTCERGFEEGDRRGN